MEWLNYHHLFYFWTVVREGSIARASGELLLAPPTISGQIRALENALGEKLFARVGRRLEPTEMGRIVYRYANEIFALGRELLDTVKGRPSGRPVRLTVGVADVVPKLIARRLLEPALGLSVPVQLVCREDKAERLLGELSLHSLDVVLSDAPLPPGAAVRAFNHPLGECAVAFFAAPKLARRLRRRFPRSLDGAPLLVPTENTSLRRSLEQWLAAEGIRPRVVAEFEDRALLKTFGQEGMGAFPAPEVIAREICRQYRVQRLGKVENLRERFFAISVERRLKHPAVVAICDEARHHTFA